MLSEFVGGFYEDSSRGFDYQRCINWFPVFTESGNSKSKAHLVGTPGKEIAVAITSNRGLGNRGLYETSAGRFFGVWGDTLNEIISSNVATDRNSLLRFSRLYGKVSMADNGISMMIVDEGKGYILTLADNTLTQIASNYPSAANQVVYHDGYFIVSVPDTKRFYFSPDGITWGALDYFSMVSTPDNITGVIRTNTDVWMFGKKSIEPWRTVVGINDFISGNTTFKRIPGAMQSIGTRNPWTIAKMKDRIYFLASNKDGYGTIQRTNGYGEPETISTDAINDKIASVGLTTDATAFTYQEKGHSFYVITIPTLGITFGYDIDSGKWHERAFFNTNTGLYERDKATNHSFAFGKNYVAFNGDNNLYTLSLDYYYDNTDVIRRERTSPHISYENKNIRYDRVEADFERGQATVTGFGSDPKIFYSRSRDGGYNFGKEKPRSTGKTGEHLKRATWWSLGTGRDWVHKLTHCYPVNADISGLYMDIEVLKS